MRKTSWVGRSASREKLLTVALTPEPVTPELTLSGGSHIYISGVGLPKEIVMLLLAKKFSRSVATPATSSVRLLSEL